MNILFDRKILPAMICSVLLVSACGGSNDTQDDSTIGSYRTSGIITGFGSVYVNGIKYETDDSSFEVDDDTEATQDDLRIGMNVTIKGSINPDGLTGYADQIIYENELEGPVSSIDNSDPNSVIISILGVDITINADTYFDHDDNDLTIDSIQVGDLLEVSGYNSTDGIIATHIEKQNDIFIADVTEIEIKGNIENLSDNQFTLRDLTIEFDGNTELDDIPGEQLVNGLYVEVKGTLNDSADLLSATKIEAEEEGLGDDDADEVELEGVIYDYNVNTQRFFIQGQEVDASMAPELIPSTLELKDDVNVEVEGSLVDGILIAEEIKLKGRKIKIHAPITNIDLLNSTVSFSVFGGTDNITAQIISQTEIEDDIGENEFLTLADLQVNDFVELEAFDDGTNTINAIELERKASNDIQLEGPVQEFNPEALTVMMFDQTFDVSQAKFEDDDSDIEIDATTFFNSIDTASFIELTDEEITDGVIDKAEIEEEDDD